MRCAPTTAARSAAVTTLLGVHMDTQARQACPFPDEVAVLAQPWLRVSG